MTTEHREIGTEARRALIATALGAALGALVALFARKERTRKADEGRGWRARSGN